MTLNLKELVANESVARFVKSDSILGLGTGSTAYYVVVRLAEELASGRLSNIRCIATSTATASEAAKRGVPLMSLDELEDDECIDLAIDGADEVDPSGNLIKGRGAALFREKMVELGAKEFVVVGDESKLVEKLGVGSMPVEIAQFAYKTTIRRLIKVCPMGTTYEVRADKSKAVPESSVPALETASTAESLKTGTADSLKTLDTESLNLVTDNGNYIVDLFFPEPLDPQSLPALNDKLKACLGVLETGFFLKDQFNPKVLIAHNDGTVKQY